MRALDLHTEREPEPSIIRATLRALLQPRRLAAILLVSASLVVAQANFSADPLAAPLGVVMCLLFVVVAPVSWRVLFPDRLDLRHGGVRLLLYGAIGAGVVLSVGVMVPRWLGIGRTLLTAPSSVMICVALFLVGGWGLARDIWLESSLVRSEARNAALAREAERAQLLALRTHLDPHFLFNTLNAIAEWCRDDGEVAERAVLQLSAMLRVVLEGVQAPTWPLRDELALVETLFALHGLRDPQRVRLVCRVPDPLPDVAVPPMVLLPLAENAVKHGAGAGHGGDVVLEVEVGRADGQIVVRLDNAGAFAGRRAGGIGLAMVERRLALVYGGRATFRIAAAGARTVAEIALPMPAAPVPAGGKRMTGGGPAALRVLVADDEAIARKRLVRLLSAMPDVTLAGECADAQDVLAHVHAGQADVVLLDIQMPELSGLEALQLFPAGGPLVIFCTAHAAHAVSAFDVGAVDYLLKPIEGGRLRKALDRARERTQARARAQDVVATAPRFTDALAAPAAAPTLDRLALPTRQGIVLLDPRDVTHALLADELVTVFTAGAEYLSALSLQELESRLPPATFARVHRRALVNLSHVVRLQPTEVGGFIAETTGGHAIEVSRQAARDLRRRLGLR